MEHGGDLISYADYYQGELIDFSSNINPLGPPKGLNELLMDSFNTLASYPDIQYRYLKKSISKYLKCNEKNVVVGNGAVEIINNIIHLFKRVIVFIPSFSEYESRAKVFGKEILKINYLEDFSLDLKKLKENMKKGDLLILGNPNNPTGLRIKKEELIKTYEIVENKGGFLLLDEAFFEFCPEDYDSIEIFRDEKFKKVGIIRAATKFFSLPGIRLGYACIPDNMIEEYKKIELPWSVNALADCAGRYIFSSKDYIVKSKDYINQERKFLLDELSKINGIKVYTTHTNYILIQLLKWDEEFVFHKFLKDGLVIRKCSSFDGLGENHIRVAIKDRDKNSRLIESFKKLERI